jgi:hypothetical protein
MHATPVPLPSGTHATHAPPPNATRATPVPPPNAPTAPVPPSSARATPAASRGTCTTPVLPHSDSPLSTSDALPNTSESMPHENTENHVPSESTDLTIKLVLPTSGRIGLSGQSKLVKAVVKMAFKRLCVRIFLENPFPDSSAGVSSMWGNECLLATAASGNIPGTDLIHRQMLAEPQYLTSLSRLVSTLFLHLHNN